MDDMDQNRKSDSAGQSDAAELVSETLVEEVSIDGMCGVY